MTSSLVRPALLVAVVLALGASAIGQERQPEEAPSSQPSGAWESPFQRLLLAPFRFAAAVGRGLKDMGGRALDDAREIRDGIRKDGLGGYLEGRLEKFIRLQQDAFEEGLRTAGDLAHGNASRVADSPDEADEAIRRKRQAAKDAERLLERVGDLYSPETGPLRSAVKAASNPDPRAQLQALADAIDGGVGAMANEVWKAGGKATAKDLEDRLKKKLKEQIAKLPPELQIEANKLIAGSVKKAMGAAQRGIARQTHRRIDLEMQTSKAREVLRRARPMVERAETLLQGKRLDNARSLAQAAREIIRPVLPGLPDSESVTADLIGLDGRATAILLQADLARQDGGGPPSTGATTSAPVVPTPPTERRMSDSEMLAALKFVSDKLQVRYDGPSKSSGPRGSVCYMSTAFVDGVGKRTGPWTDYLLETRRFDDRATASRRAQEMIARSLMDRQPVSVTSATINGVEVRIRVTRPVSGQVKWAGSSRPSEHWKSGSVEFLWMLDDVTFVRVLKSWSAAIGSRPQVVGWSDKQMIDDAVPLRRLAMQVLPPKSPSSPPSGNPARPVTKGGSP